MTSSKRRSRCGLHENGLQERSRKYHRDAVSASVHSTKTLHVSIARLCEAPTTLSSGDLTFNIDWWRLLQNRPAKNIFDYYRYMKGSTQHSRTRHARLDTQEDQFTCRGTEKSSTPFCFVVLLFASLTSITRNSTKNRCNGWWVLVLLHIR